MNREQKQKILQSLENIKKIIKYKDIESMNDVISYLNSLRKKVCNPGCSKYIDDFFLQTDDLKKLDCLQNLQKELRDYFEKKTILFLPYKSSMWDSMESVYNAARLDSRVNVKVMPIPYDVFDKNLNTTHFNYEGKFFENFDEFISYEDYDIEMEMPDIIIIHNPYDDCNRVTRISREYFSSELVKYTQHLVYIPYDIVTGNRIDSSYCRMPGVQNAWRVYVQSESVREEYSCWNDEKKIRALGSPKVDVVLNKRRESVKWTNSWLQKVKGKKVFLYNTHLSGIILEAQERIAAIKKMGDFFEMSADVVLLWRPHPLSIQTAQAMNPVVLKDYLDLVDYMKSLDNVIYDDSSLLDDAIIMSDAYIGDQSSLVMLFGFTGKPMYLHSFLRKSFSDFRGVLGICAVVVGDQMWIPHSHFNALFKVNIYSGQVEYVCKFPFESKNKELLFQGVYNYGDWLLFVPYLSDNFYWYNIKTGVFEVELYKATTKLKSFLKVHVGTKIYLFSNYYHNPNVRVNLVTRDIETFSIDLQPFADRGARDGMIWGNIGAYAYDRFWLFSKEMLSMVSISEKGDMQVYSMGIECGDIRQIAFDGDKFWLLPQFGTRVFCWGKDEAAELIEIEDVHCNEYKTYPYDGMLIDDSYVWIIPQCARYILQINKESRLIQRKEIPSSVFVGVEQLETVFSGFQDAGRYIYIFPNRKSCLIRVKKETLEIQIIDILLPEYMDFKWMDNYLFDYSGNVCPQIDDYIYRDTIFDIEYFVQNVKADTEEMRNARKQAFCNSVANGDGTSGEHILEDILSGFNED